MASAGSQEKSGKRLKERRCSDTATSFNLDSLSEELSEVTSGCLEVSRADSSSSLHRNSPSRIPLYVAHGPQPHHSPLHVRSPKPVCGIHCTTPTRIVPDAVRRQQVHHNITNHLKQSRPSVGMQDTAGQLEDVIHSPLRSQRRGSGPSVATAAVPVVEGRRGCKYSDYVPLCQLQKALKRGEVLEGILRINPKNYEDAYISCSAPGEVMDILVSGVNDRNRSLDGDKVALQLNPASDWKILYDTIVSNWHNWESRYEQESGLPKSLEVVTLEPESRIRPASPIAHEHDQCTEKTDNLQPQDDSLRKKKRSRKHNRSKKHKVMNSQSPEEEKQELGPSAQNETSLKVKKGKSMASKSSRILVPEKKSAIKQKTIGKAIKVMSGLPRDLCALTPAEMLAFSFGPYCVQKTAKVIGILEQNHSRLAGGKISLLPGNNQLLKFSPLDSRTPRILLSMDEVDPTIVSNIEHHSNGLFLATITDWPVDSALPFGKLVQFLGESGDIEVESQLILLENKVIDAPFPSELESELLERYSEWKTSHEEISKRLDFTSKCVFTIDPATARDLDDALSIVPLDETVNNEPLFEVGVHIADVSHFVKEGTLLDEVACERSTSFYLVQRVVPMLPRLLCEKLCSLTPGQEKLTFSVIWKMDSTGRIYSTHFSRSVIRSCVKLSYDHAQQMIDKPDSDAMEHNVPQIADNWSRKDIKTAVLLLNGLAQNLRKKRFEEGALRVDKVKFNFVLDSETGLPSGFSVSSLKEANFLVEELMLLANMSVGQKILDSFPDKAILRRHPAPDEKKLREMKLFCETAGFDLDTTSAGSLHAAMRSLKSASNSQVFSLLLLKAMKNALYFCSGALTPELYPHYALSVPVYTHFTSPIRRYPDILVHRQLAASLDYEAITTLSTDDLQKMTGHCNLRKQASRMVSEKSQLLFLNLYLESTSLVETAVVNNVLDRSFDVLVPKFGIVSRVYLDRIPLKGFKFQSQAGKRCLQLTWPVVNGSKGFTQVITIFSEVNVRLSVNPQERSKITSVLVPPSS